MLGAVVTGTDEQGTPTSLMTPTSKITPTSLMTHVDVHMIGQQLKTLVPGAKVSKESAIGAAFRQGYVSGKLSRSGCNIGDQQVNEIIKYLKRNHSIKAAKGGIDKENKGANKAKVKA